MPIEVEIPGFGLLSLSHLVSDYNGTLARDGVLLPGVRETLAAVSEKLSVHVVTADTFGMASRELQGLPLSLTILGEGSERNAKARLVSFLEGGVAVLGNGANDLSMMEMADLAVAVLEGESLYAPLLERCPLLARGAVEALELFLNPTRLKATLRF